MLNHDELIALRRANFKRAVFAGQGNIYTYGLDVLNQDYAKFIAEGKHEAHVVSPDYEPNPYVFQYDLEVHIFIHYDDLVLRQAKFLERKIAEAKGEELIQLNNKLDFLNEYGTGFSRDEHFWNAVSIRWPSRIVDGEVRGVYIREPWSEDFVKVMCDYEYVNMFGGSGQGKTHRALAFGCVIWDHYIETYLGGRFRFSTVAEDKMKESTWPYVKRIYANSQPGISLYSGRGVIAGEYTIHRPNDPKGGGSIKGILLPRRNDSVSVDKITGSHGHPFGMYHIDEAQSTPEAPFEASPNFLQNCGFGWITASGNYDSNNDCLGKNVKPVNGWDTIDDQTHIYESINMLGIRSGCIHYNNDLSPAFEGEGARKWGHILPTKAKKRARYPSPSSRRTNAYRRLWVGWREKENVTDAVLNKTTLREMGCMKGDANFDTNYPVEHSWSFDSAPVSKDRNILLHFADGIDAETGRWKIHFYDARALEKIENVNEYIAMTTKAILEFSKAWGVKSGNAIMDWTNITGVPEELLKQGFKTKCLVYNQAPPDGQRRDTRTREVYPAVIVDSITNKKAHQEVTNQISMGALLLQNFVINGQVTGLSDDFIHEDNSDRSLDEELCLRKFVTVPSKSHGELLALEQKHSKSGNTGFTKTNGFSPDILDCMFQAAAYCAMHRGMIPGYKDGKKSTYNRKVEITEEEDFKAELDLYEGDEIIPIKVIDSGGPVDYTIEIEDEILMY